MRMILIPLSMLLMLTPMSEQPEPEVITLRVVETQTEAPKREEEAVIIHHDISKDDADLLSRLLWSSPLRDEHFKKMLLWVVFNRTYQQNEFPNTIRENINEHEFSFFDSHAHRSAENARIVQCVWDAYQSMRDGYYIGYHPSNLGLYIRFTGEGNREIEIMHTKDGGAL